MKFFNEHTETVQKQYNEHFNVAQNNFYILKPNNKSVKTIDDNVIELNENESGVLVKYKGYSSKYDCAVFSFATYITDFGCFSFCDDFMLNLDADCTFEHVTDNVQTKSDGTIKNALDDRNSLVDTEEFNAIFPAILCGITAFISAIIGIAIGKHTFIANTFIVLELLACIVSAVYLVYNVFHQDILYDKIRNSNKYKQKEQLYQESIELSKEKYASKFTEKGITFIIV